MCNKKNLTFIDYKKCLLNDEIIPKSQQRIRSEGHDVHTEKVRKIALSNNDDKRLQPIIRLQYIHMVLVLEECVKQSC